MKSLLYPCLPWYDASDEWLFACSGDAKQSEVFPIIPFPIIPLETNSKNQLARSKKSPVWTMTGKVTIWGFLSEKKKQGYNRIKALSLCQGCTRSLGRAPGRPSPWACGPICGPICCLRCWSLGSWSSEAAFQVQEDRKEMMSLAVRVLDKHWQCQWNTNWLQVINCSENYFFSVFLLTLCETQLSAEDRSLD